VDPDQDDRATEIKLCSFARPHMRSFHVNWFGFFMAFFIWFAITPLLSEIKDTLKLTKQEVWTSSIVGVSGTITMRFILGPLIDKYGARIPFTFVLCLCAIPTACTGFVNSATGLAVIRLFIGLAGGSFVMCQSWTSKMFARKIVGTANAIAGGWGNLGGGVTQLIMGSVLFPIFKNVFNDAEKSWRFISVIPACVTFATGLFIYFATDDLPKGNYSELKKHGTIVEISATKSFRRGAANFNSWLLAFQYACSFGVEITMHNAASLYFKEEFKLSTEDAAAVASIFGFFNIFSRALGGYVSDICNRHRGMRGRIYLQFSILIATAAFVLWFQSTRELWLAIFVMVFFSITCQAACGTTYGIVPYVDPTTTGSISGIVGAGGNIGAVGFGLGFRSLDARVAFKVMGFTIFAAAASCMMLKIKGCSTFWGGVDLYDNEEVTKTLEVPEMATKEQPNGTTTTTSQKIVDDDVEEEYA
jgi:MFS transporter, NNP family, nitrate/nitrite transporter